MVFFESSPLVVEQLHRNFASVDMNIKQFSEFCKTACYKKHGFIVIDLSRDHERFWWNNLHILCKYILGGIYKKYKWIKSFAFYNDRMLKAQIKIVSDKIVL